MDVTAMSDAAAIAPQRIGDMLGLRGEVALETGAGRGIGETTAHFLAAQGAAVAVNDYYPERAAGVVAAIKAEGMVTYLASATERWITGQTYPADGGFSVNQ